MSLRRNIMAGATVSGMGLSATILSFSPWGYWKLDETGTLVTAIDSSGNVRNGTYTGTGTVGGNAGLVTGSNSSITTNGSGKINLPDLPLASGQKLTVISTFKLSNAGLNQLLASDLSSPRIWQFRSNAGTLQLTIFNPSAITISSASGVNDNVTHMAAFVVDPTLAIGSGQSKLYLDGVLVASSVVAMSLPVATAKPAIGSRGTTAISEPFIGGLDDAVIILNALSGADILSIWNARNTL